MKELNEAALLNVLSWERILIVANLITAVMGSRLYLGGERPEPEGGEENGEGCWEGK